MKRRMTGVQRAPQLGVSLVELMVALMLGMVLLVALVGVFSSTNQARRELGRSMEMHESGRYAVNYLHDELSQAGFLGGLPLTPTLLNLNLKLPCSTLESEWAQSLAIHVQGGNQDDTSSLFSCISGLRKPGTDAIFIQRVSTCIAGATGCTPAETGRAYLQVSLCGSEFALNPFVLGTLPADANLSPFKLLSKNCLPSGQQAPLRAYIRRIFYVSNQNELSYVDIFPGVVSQPVVIGGGIDNLQIEYAVDTNSDGVPDVITHVPNSLDWPNVVGARVWVLARSSTESPQAQGTSFALGDATVTPNDRFKRHIFSTYIVFMTPQGQREQ